MAFIRKGMFKGRRKGSPRIVPKDQWLTRSDYAYRLASGALDIIGPVVVANNWLNNGTGGLSTPWDNNEFWVNGV
jgi:hypothetical protein